MKHLLTVLVLTVVILCLAPTSLADTNIYQMFGETPVGDYGHHKWAEWARINPAPNVYNWTYLDRYIAQADAKGIPIVIRVIGHLSDVSEDGRTYFIDCTPAWVKEYAPSHEITSGGVKAVIPAYDNREVWWPAWFAMIDAMGERYTDDPRVKAIIISIGLDGEPQPCKDADRGWNALMRQQASAVEFRFGGEGQLVEQTMQRYRLAFPDKPLYMEHAPGGEGMRLRTSTWAAEAAPPIGLKHSGMWVDAECHEGHGTFIGLWDMVNVHSNTLPIAVESPYGIGGHEIKFWSLYAGLHYHPEWMSLHKEYFTDLKPHELDWANQYLGVTIATTPGAWVVFRDAEYPLQGTETYGCSGKTGPWTFWATPHGKWSVVQRQDLPCGRESVYARQAGYVEAITIDIFDQFCKLEDEHVVRIVYLDVGLNLMVVGADAEYRVQMTDSGEWKTVNIPVRLDALSKDDLTVRGGIYIHKIEILRTSGAEPKATPTPTVYIPMVTSTPNATPTPSATPWIKIVTGTPAPTYTPYPTYTPAPTYTPLPTPDYEQAFSEMTWENCLGWAVVNAGRMGVELHVTPVIDWVQNCDVVGR